MFSKDDDVVPLSHAEKYRKKLNKANIIIYKSKNGHFRIAEFPEIVKMIKRDVQKV
jgi:predicted alpha/beta hydrolase family esterase